MESTGIRKTKSRVCYFWALGGFLLALLVRWPLVRQSLWYDEMVTLVDYVLQPWHKVLAAGAGQYVPNNHVLHTILVKAINCIWDQADLNAPNEMLLRLPALLAGCLLPIALAWPLRHRKPLLALLVATVACLHPWLIAFSTEARGYSLLLLLGVLATHALPKRVKGFSVTYALLIAAALYTVPIALLLLPAHAVAVLALRRSTWRSWIIGATLGVLIATALYLPMARGILQYYRQPYGTTISFAQLLDQLPRYAMAGERLPRPAFPFQNFTAGATSALLWALPVLILVIGSLLVWTVDELRPLIVTLIIATLLGISLARLSPAATEVRFVPWIGLWFCIAVLGFFVNTRRRIDRGLVVAGAITLLGWLGVRDRAMLPNQPIREALHLCDQLAPPQSGMMTVYLGSREAAFLYHDQVTRHDLIAGDTTAGFLEGEALMMQKTHRRPWLVIFYEDLARRRDGGKDESSRGLWTELVKHYQLVTRLPGRVAPVAIYAPREAIDLTVNTTVIR